MGYRIERRSPTNWRLVHRHDNGKNLKTRVITKGSPEFFSLGLAESMTLDEAKRMLESQRASLEVKRLNERKAKIFKELKEKSVITGAWLPEDIVKEFEVNILPHKPIKPLHWQVAKKLISKITMGPSEWSWMPEFLTNQLIGLGYSWDYSSRIWAALGAYGAFYCYKTKGSWGGLPKLSKQVKGKIIGKYEDKHSDKYNTFPLNKEMLLVAKTKLSEQEYNWLRIAFFFGLRPQEMKALTNKNNSKSTGTWFISTDDPRFKFVLNVYQEKLKNRTIMKRWLWKAIPAVEPEQIELLPLFNDIDKNIREVQFPNRPNNGRLKHHVHPRICRRSPRRGFAPWLTDLGYSKSIISVWLGHVRPETYMQDRHYGDPHVVSYEAPFKKVG